MVGYKQDIEVDTNVTCGRAMTRHCYLTMMQKDGTFLPTKVITPHKIPPCNYSYIFCLCPDS